MNKIQLNWTTHCTGVHRFYSVTCRKFLKHYILTCQSGRFALVGKFVLPLHIRHISFINCYSNMFSVGDLAACFCWCSRFIFMSVKMINLSFCTEKVIWLLFFLCFHLWVQLSSSDSFLMASLLALMKLSYAMNKSVVVLKWKDLLVNKQSLHLNLAGKLSFFFLSVSGPECGGSARRLQILPCLFWITIIAEAADFFQF